MPVRNAIQMVFRAQILNDAKWVTDNYVSGEGMGEMTASAAACGVEGVGLLEESVGTDEGGREWSVRVCFHQRNIIVRIIMLWDYPFMRRGMQQSWGAQ